jgi:hypothetical protein
MKKILLALFIAAPALGVAQETATVNVSTNINPAFTISATDLVFGEVSVGDEVTVSAITGDATNAGSTAARAVITATADLPLSWTISGSDVTGTQVTLSNAGVITYVDPDIIDPILLNDPANIVSDTRRTITVSLSFAIDENDPVAYTLGETTGASSVEENTFYIGGTFTAPAIVGTVNNYTGSITVSAIYF